MVYCCVPMCKNKAGNSKFTFFHFPSDEKQRQLWTDRVRRINPDGSKWVPTPYSLICSYHFSKGRTQGAPDRFEWNENKQFIYSSPTKQNIRRRSSIKRRKMGDRSMTALKKLKRNSGDGKHPLQEVTCSCKRQCKNLTSVHLKSIFDDYYGLADKTKQCSYIMGLMTVVDISRRRHGTYDTPEDSRRQCTVSYVLPNGSGNHVPVCRKTFQQTFAVSPKAIQVLTERKKKGETTYVEKRGGKRTVKIGGDLKAVVRRHIVFDVAPSERIVRNDETRLSGGFQSAPGTAVASDVVNCLSQSCPDKSSNEGSAIANRDSHEAKQFSRGKGTRCAVAACSNSLGRTKSQPETHDVRYHAFPKDPAVRQRWIEGCRRTGEWKPTSSHVCSEHFIPDDYERDLQAELMGTRAKKVLKKDAVPSRNLAWATYGKVVTDPMNNNTCPTGSHGWTSMNPSETSDKNQDLTQDSQNDAHGEVLQQPSIKKLKPNIIPPVVQGTVVADVSQPRDLAAKEHSSNATKGQSFRQVDELLNNPPESYVQLLEKSLKSVIAPALSPGNSLDVSATRINELESQMAELMDSNNQLESMCKQLTLDNAVLQKKLATANGKIEKKGCRATALAKELRGCSRQSRHLEKMEAAMDSLFTPSQKRLLLNRNKKVMWDKQTLAIAWTLRCISEQAYEYLRTNLKYPLPSHSTLKRTAAALKSGGLPSPRNEDSPDIREEDVPEEHLLDIKEENLSDEQDEDFSDSRDSEFAPDIKEENLSDMSDAREGDLSDAEDAILPDVPEVSGAIQGLRSFCEQQMACFDMMECVLEEG